MKTTKGLGKIFVSYSHDSQEHKDRVLRFAEILREDGLDCHIDQYELSPNEGWPKWMVRQIEDADFVLVVCTETYTERLSGKEEPNRGLGAKWEGSLITQQIYEEGGQNIKFIPIVFDHQDTEHIPVFLRPFTYYDISSNEGYETLYRHLTQQPEIIRRQLGTFKKKPTREISVSNDLPVAGSASSKKSVGTQFAILESLRTRLIADFSTKGASKGQFGAGGGRREDRHYQVRQGESLKVKPAYYLTYWGWRAAKLLLPEMIDEWSKHTFSGIIERFAGERWIEVQLRDYETPTALVRTVEAIRHTARAAEILLLINEGNTIATQVAWDLIQEASSLQNPDGGWKEFRQGEQISSLYSSLYVFHFLSAFQSRTSSSAIQDSSRDFDEKITTCISMTAAYLETQWREQKWKFGNLPWKVSAHVTFAEYVPFANNSKFIRQVRDSIAKLLNQNGRLIHPDVGKSFDAPEYVLTVRIAYALWCAKKKLQETDVRLDATIMWLRQSYLPSLTLNTCDVAFLTEMLLAPQS